MAASEDVLLDRFGKDLFGERRRVPAEWMGVGTLKSRYPINGLASASVALVGVALREFAEATGAAAFAAATSTDPARIAVDRGLVSAWFATMFEPIGWTLPSPWDALAGDYEASDGWIRLHTNAPHHRARALEVLGCEPDRDAVAAAVAGWRASELEAAVVAAGGCAARLQSEREWLASEQGESLAAQPIIDSAMVASRGGGSARFAPGPDQPLSGIRVLDLTRVLAGPVATRCLAGLGADVLRVDPPDWDEPAVVPEMTLGKRSARLDAKTPAGLAKLKQLAADADVIVHGYRADALDALGLGDEELHALRPGVVTVAINAYGWDGPWQNRRGFDSLVQMSTGIAHPVDGGRPTPLPVQALDHATGYLGAAAAINGLRDQIVFGTGTASYVSLARTARELVTGRQEGLEDEIGEPVEFTRQTIRTPWGKAGLLQSPLTLDGHGMLWRELPRPLGADRPEW